MYGASRTVLPLAVALCALAASASAALADSIYWSDYQNAPASNDGIKFGPLGADSNQTLFPGETLPQGIAIDPAAGKIYWAASSANAIRVANLDGSGTPQTLFPGESGAAGLAIDPVAGKLYWAAYGASAIRVGNLDGSGAGPLFPGESGASGVAIDPAAGKIYWTTYGYANVRVGNLNGTGAANVFTGENYPTGIAVDPAAGRLYWSNEFGRAIRTGLIADPGSAEDLYSNESYPGGVAIDPAAGKIYWANINEDPGRAGPNSIRMGNLDGSGTPQSIITGLFNPWYVSVLRAPAGAGAPTANGGGETGQALSCSAGSWAPDFVSGSVFRAPRDLAYEWLKDGTPIAGATAVAYTPFAAGAYSCRVTASNQAGSTPQTSAVRTITAPPAGGAQTPVPGTGPTPGTGQTPAPTDTSKVKIVKRGGFFPPRGFSKRQVCKGKVFVTLTLKKKRLGFKTVRLNKKCRYTVTFTILRAKLKGAKTVKVTARFGGNRYLAAVAKTYTVKVPAKK